MRTAPTHPRHAVAMAGITLAAVAMGVVVASSSPASAKSSAFDVTDTYVVITEGETEGMQYIRLVSKSSGDVLATVGSAKLTKLPPGDDPDLETMWRGGFGQVALVADGSVFAVVEDEQLPRPYQSRLNRYSTAGVQRVRPYVTSVVASPDKKNLAIKVLAPDTDGDDFGIEAIRITDMRGSTTSTAISAKFPVMPGDGGPLVNLMNTSINAWLPNGDLALEGGCCGGTSVWLTPSSRTSLNRGNGALMPRRDKQLLHGGSIVGYRRDAALAIAEDGFPNRRISVRWITAADANGPTIHEAKLTDDSDYGRFIDNWIAQTGATPLGDSVDGTSPEALPYRGPGEVVYATL